MQNSDIFIFNIIMIEHHVRFYSCNKPVLVCPVKFFPQKIYKHVNVLFPLIDVMRLKLSPNFVLPFAMSRLCDFCHIDWFLFLISWFLVPTYFALSRLKRSYWKSRSSIRQGNVHTHHADSMFLFILRKLKSEVLFNSSSWVRC